MFSQSDPSAFLEARNSAWRLRVYFFKILILFIFDEPSASLDPENARRFFDIVLRVFQEKTVVVITHDLKNLHWADQIMVLKNGIVSEIGAPQELGENNSAFRLLRDGSKPLVAEAAAA